MLVNGAEKQHKSADFLAMNGFGQVPVLRDGDTVIRDSQAILVYLARQYGGEQWLPNDAAGLAEVSQLAYPPPPTKSAVARMRCACITKFGWQLALADAEQISHNLLSLLQQQLQQRPYLWRLPNIADIALYPTWRWHRKPASICSRFSGAGLADADTAARMAMSACPACGKA